MRLLRAKCTYDSIDLAALWGLFNRSEWGERLEGQDVGLSLGDLLVLSEENRPWRLGRVFSTQLGGKGTLYPGGVFAKPPELILKWLRFWQTEEVLTQTRVYFKGNVIRKMLSQLAGRLCRAIKILVAELFGEIKRGYIRVNMQTSTWTPHPSPLLGPGEPTLRYWGHQTQCEMDTFRDPGGASYHSLQSCT